MYRTTNFFAGMILLAISPLAFSQDPQLASPQVPEDALATEQLIVWSRTQKPQPAPQPLPPQDTQVPQPGQDQDQQAKPPADPQTQQSPTSQSFTGKIVKDAGKYVLQVINLGNPTTPPPFGDAALRVFSPGNFAFLLPPPL